MPLKETGGNSGKFPTGVKVGAFGSRITRLNDSGSNFCNGGRGRLECRPRREQRGSCRSSRGPQLGGAGAEAPRASRRRRTNPGKKAKDLSDEEVETLLRWAGGSCRPDAQELGARPWCDESGADDSVAGRGSRGLAVRHGRGCAAADHHSLELSWY